MARIRPATVIAGLGVLVIGMAPRLCAGQSAQSASLVGKVTDESGGAMAGVTVTLKSPALQVPQATTVTGADGDYRLLELPPGVYTVTFELTGFQTSARTDVHLTTGSAGRVDVVMKIGALSETVQVSGLSPVVDTVNVAGQTTLVQEQLRSIPMGGTTAATTEQSLPQFNWKVNYQVSRTTKLTASQFSAVKHHSTMGGAGQLRPLPSTTLQRQPDQTW